MPGKPVDIVSAQQHHLPISFGSTEASDKYERFFGPKPPSLAPSPYDQVAYTNYDLPEYYKGKNLFLENTIEGFILEDIQWYTTICLPWAKTDQHHVTFNTWTFNQVLASRVPHEGISRLVTSSKKQFKDHVVRRGLAFVLEGDFYTTPEGIEHYAKNIRGIAQSVQETQNHDTIMSLLLSKSYFQIWEDEFGKMKVPNRKIVESEIRNFAAFAKNYKQFDIIYERHKRFMLKQGVTPDLLIFPPGAKIYVSMVQPKKTEYWAAGERGLLNLRQGPESMATMTDGTAIFETRDFGVDETGPMIQLLTRKINNTEYYEMTVREWRSDDLSEYLSRWRDIYLIDMSIDDMSKVTFKAAFMQTKIFVHDGDKLDYSPDLKKFVEAYQAMVKNSGGQVQTRTAELTFGEANGDRDSSRRDGGYDSAWNASLYHGGKQGMAGAGKAFFLSAADNEGVYHLIEYFGQMNLESATSEDFRQVAQTIVAKISGDHSSDMTIWHDMLFLIHQIESESYDERYYEALIAANIGFSIDENDKFFGEKTPASLKSAVITEWKPNSFGSLRLPQEGSEDVNFPSGYANGPGFLTLASEANNPSSRWYEVGKRAAHAVELLHRIIHRLGQILPRCEMLSASNRSPWFHKEDAIATFFQLVSVNRDPIFIGHLRASLGANSKVRGKTSGAKAMEVDRDEIAWAPVPIFEVTTKGLADDQPSREALNKLLRDGKTDSRYFQEKAVTDLFIFDSIALGGKVILHRRFLQNAAMLSKEIKAMTLMGKLSYRALIKIAAIIRDPKSYEGLGFDDDQIKKESGKRIDKLVTYILEFSAGSGDVTKIRRIILGLSTVFEPPQNGLKILDMISYSKDAPVKVRKDGIAQLRKLLEAVAEKIDDTSIIVENAPEAKLLPQGILDWRKKDVIRPKETASFSEVSKELDKIIRLVAEVNGYRSVAQVGYAAGTFDLDTSKSWWTFVPDDASSEIYKLVDAKTNDLKSLVIIVNGKVNTLIREKGSRGTKDEEKTLWQKEALERGPSKRSKIYLQDDEEASFGIQFYRSPLTMSLPLLESLSSVGARAFIRPSDPSTGHIQAFAMSEGETLPGNVFRRPQYAHIGDVIKNETKARSLEHLTFISKHKDREAGKNFLQSKPSYGNSSMDYDDGNSSSSDDSYSSRDSYPAQAKFKKMKGETFSEDSSDAYGDSEDDAIDQLLQGKSTGRQGKRKSQSIGMRIGDDIGGFKTPGKDQKWTKKDLRDRKHGGYDVRRGFDQEGERYSDLHLKIHTPSFEARFHDANTILDPIVRVAAQCFLTTQSFGRDWVRLIDCDVHVPINIILWRLFITHDMSSVILMKRGLDTGGNLYGHANFSLGNDVVSKLIYGNFTFNSKAMVWNEKNVHIIENLKSDGYSGGSNTVFIERRDQLNNTANDKPSLIATAVPITEPKLPWIASFTGDLGIPDLNATIDGIPASYSTAPFYEKIWRINQFTSTKRDPGEGNFFQKAKSKRTNGLEGQMLRFNRQTKQYDRVVECKGHRVGGCYPGALQVWNGNDAAFEKFDWKSRQYD